MSKDWLLGRTQKQQDAKDRRQAKLDKLNAKAFFDGIMVEGDMIIKGDESHPLTGVKASVERGSDLQKRITATRLLAFGVFAVAMQKKSGGEWWLTVEGPEFAWTVQVDGKRQAMAREHADRINTAARAATE